MAPYAFKKAILMAPYSFGKAIPMAPYRVLQVYRMNNLQSNTDSGDRQNQREDVPRQRTPRGSGNSGTQLASVWDIPGTHSRASLC